MITDDFNRANSGGLGVNWANTLNTMRITSNEARPATDAVYNFDRYTGASWNSVHASEAILRSHGGAVDAELTVCHQANGDLYMFMVHLSFLRIYKYIAGSFTQIGSDLGGSSTDGHTYKYERSDATSLKAYDNGVQAGSTQSDATLSGGAPGIGGAVATEGWDDWVGTGETVTTAVPFVPPVYMIGGRVSYSMVPSGLHPSAFAAHASSSFTPISSMNHTGGVNGGESGTFDSSGADLIVVSVSSFNLSAAPVVTDNKGNGTYNQLTSINGNVRQTIYYVRGAITVGSGHTITTTGTNIFSVTIAHAFSGSQAFDAQNGATSSSSPLATGAVVPSVNGALVFSAIAQSGIPSGITIPSGFTTGPNVSYSPGNNFGNGSAYYIQPTAGSINPSWSWTGTMDAAAAVAVFIPYP